MASIVADIPMLGAMRAGQVHRLAMAGSLPKLATGVRVGRGTDGPASLVAVTQLESAIRQADAEVRAAERAQTQAFVVDGALGEVSELLVEAYGIAIASANDAALTPAERQANQLELDSVLGGIDRIASSTTFGGAKLLDGTATLRALGVERSISDASTRSIGAVEIDGESYVLSDARDGGEIDLSSDGGAAEQAVEAAIGQINAMRAQVGAFAAYAAGAQRRALESAYAGLSSAASGLRDTDSAAQAAAMIRSQMLANTSATLLGTASTRPEQVMALIG